MGGATDETAPTTSRHIRRWRRHHCSRRFAARERQWPAVRGGDGRVWREQRESVRGSQDLPAGGRRPTADLSELEDDLQVLPRTGIVLDRVAVEPLEPVAPRR